MPTRKTAVKRPAAARKTKAAASKQPARKKAASKQQPARKKAASKRPARKKAASKQQPARKKAASTRPARKKAASKRPAREKVATRKTAASKRPVAREVVAKAATRSVSVPRMKAAPVAWRLETGAQAVGIFVDADSVYVGNDVGEIFRCGHDGAVKQSYKLPDGVKCIFEDEDWRYAGCDDGNVYDLTGKVPRAIFQIGKDVEINWIEVFRGNLLVCDARGGVTVVGPDEQVVWEVLDGKYDHAWMLRADVDGLYHGGKAGIRKLEWTRGKPVWKVKTNGCHFGWDCGSTILGITNDPALVVVDKASGAVVLRMDCTSDHADFSPNGAECCAAGNGRYYGASGGFVFCFDSAGERVFEAPTGCGTACSMHYFADRLYLVTSKGVLLCLDVSPAAVAAALGGALPTSRSVRAPKVGATDVKQLEVTREVAGGVVLVCVKEGGKLRVKVESRGHDSSWFVQFPRDLRVAGARYVVDELREATQGGFYRVRGDIRRLK